MRASDTIGPTALLDMSGGLGFVVKDGVCDIHGCFPL
jgi:hypothetical protein